MKECYGNIWDYHKAGNWIVITTNGFVRKDGACVMGRGIALQAKNKYPRLPFALGNAINQRGNHTHLFVEYRIITFPVKHKWFEKADIELIERSAKELATLDLGTAIYMVRPGCGNGQLEWSEVRPVLERHLDDNFIVVERR